MLARTPAALKKRHYRRRRRDGNAEALLISGRLTDSQSLRREQLTHQAESILREFTERWLRLRVIHKLGAGRHGSSHRRVHRVVEINTGRLHVRRSKKGTPSVHPMQGDEIRALRRLQREQEASPYVFTSERGGPMSAKSFGTLFERLGRRAGMSFTIFPHMLRHACGYALANAGHDTRALQAWLGHKNIQHTVRYTELAPDRFKNFWR
jgi:type 1 fimbriae regulatory protein FimB/type 1 fimbriae regulatory protein FimE